MAEEEEKKRQHVKEMVSSIGESIDRAYPQPPVKIVKSNRLVFFVGYATGLITGIALSVFIFRMWELFL